MKSNLLHSFLVAALVASTITPSLQAISIPSLADKARQVAAKKLKDVQEKLATMQKNTAEFGQCVLKDTCTSQRQKQLSTALKISAAALATLMIALIAAGSAAALARRKKAPTTVQPIQLSQNTLKFFAAVTNGNIFIAQEMLNQGVPIDERDIRGWNALSIAASQDNLEMVNFLLQKGAPSVVAESVWEITTPEIKEIILK